MKGKRPKISVGMPVYNEAKYIRETVDCVLRQSFCDLELIICDNCSTDETWFIIQQLVHRDGRITALRNEKNIGAADNFSTVLSLASGEYFIWLSGHDIWSDDYLEQLFDSLSDQKHAVLSYGTPTLIDQKGTEIGRTSGWYDSAALGVCTRLTYVILGSMNPVMGLIRADTLRSLPKPVACIGLDLIILFNLALEGGFLHVGSACWSRRENRVELDYKARLARYRSTEFKLSSGWLSNRFPFLYLIGRLYSSLLHSRIRFSAKIFAAIILPFALLAKRIDFHEAESHRLGVGRQQCS